MSDETFWTIVVIAWSILAGGLIGLWLINMDSNR